MPQIQDKPKVYRLQGLPDGPNFDRLAATQLLASVINDPTLTADDINICSLATDVDPHKIWNRKVATVMFKRTPSALAAVGDANNSSASEWRFPVAGRIDPLVLDTHFMGLTVLNDVSMAEHKFDCIALSGLASHPFGSWQPKGDDKSYMWIRDTLPTTIDGVRFILYGYDTTLKNSNSFQTIVDLANTLYQMLRTNGWESTSTKPLVFLAHSLGGVLLKQLLVMLAGANDGAQFMLSMIKGAVFFGTPSRGMALGQLLTMVGDQPNRELVEHLSETSAYLPNLETQFSGISQLQRMRLYWAYETQTSPTVQNIDGLYERSGPRLIMVDRRSATGSHDLDPSLTIQIDEDHSNMVKFNRGDHRTPIIINKIQEICTSGKATDGLDTTQTTMTAVSDSHYGNDTSYSGPDLLEDALSSELVGWDHDLIISLLPTAERDQRHEQIDQNFGHTFSWAFENSSIGLSQWLIKGEGIFWIDGKPGSGKSTFMKFLLNNDRTKELLTLWKSKPGRIIASFFFHHRGTHLQKSFDGLLRSLFIQLLNGDVRLHKIVGGLQSEKAAELYEAIQSDVHTFFRHCSIEHGSTAHQKRMVAVLSENPSLRLHRIIEEEALDMTSLDRALVKITLLRDFDRLSLASRSKRAHVEVEESACQKLLLQFPKYEKPIRAIVRRWSESLDMSGRIQKILNEVHTNALKPNDKRHFTGLIERQKARRLRLINNHLKWWTQVNPEEGLRHVFNQSTFDLEVCLFFDALDEYEGSPEFISAFLKEIVEVKSTSKTRTKILFSSRPWTTFRDQFDKCPKISIHEHTKDDIEQYCAAFLPVCDRAQALIIPFVGEIANRARGVFLWVKLVMSDLAAIVTIPGKTEEELSVILRRCLDELPDELEQYYSTIIHRLPASTRRESYILLESLSKSSQEIFLSDVPQLLACGMSESLDEALDIIERESAPGLEDPEGHVRTISGGLVDLVLRRGSSSRDIPLNASEPSKSILRTTCTLQLMHQTVKDCVASPTFKRTVLGDRANMTWQNGHNFLVKYYFYQLASAQGNALRSEILEHVVKAEMTSGVSQYVYLSQLPRGLLAHIVLGSSSLIEEKLRTPKLAIHPVREKELEQSLDSKRKEAYMQQPLNSVSFGMELAAIGGLSLYLSESVRRDRLVFQRPVGPLISILLIQMRHKSGLQPLKLVQARLASIKLILEHGFEIQSDPAALSLIFEGIWCSTDQQAARMYMDLVMAAVRKGLPIRDDFDISLDPGNPTSLLHLSPPILAEHLLENGADANKLNGVGQTPLDYIIDPQSVFQRSTFGLGCLYDIIRLLINNDARRHTSTNQHLPKLIQRLNDNGYDISLLLSLLDQSPVMDELPLPKPLCELM